MVIQSESKEETQLVQQPERMNFITGKQRMHVKTSLEIVRMDEYALGPDEIPEDEKIMLPLKKDEQTLIKYPALFDAGGTISAMTPRVAEKMIEQLGIKHIGFFIHGRKWWRKRRRI